MNKDLKKLYEYCKSQGYNESEEQFQQDLSKIIIEELKGEDLIKVSGGKNGKRVVAGALSALLGMTSGMASAAGTTPNLKPSSNSTVGGFKSTRAIPRRTASAAPSIASTTKSSNKLAKILGGGVLALIPVGGVISASGIAYALTHKKEEPKDPEKEIKDPKKIEAPHTDNSQNRPGEIEPPKINDPPPTPEPGPEPDVQPGFGPDSDAPGKHKEVKSSQEYCGQLFDIALNEFIARAAACGNFLTDLRSRSKETFYALASRILSSSKAIYEANPAEGTFSIYSLSGNSLDVIESFISECSSFINNSLKIYCKDYNSEDSMALEKYTSETKFESVMQSSAGIDDFITQKLNNMDEGLYKTLEKEISTYHTKDLLFIMRALLLAINDRTLGNTRKIEDIDDKIDYSCRMVNSYGFGIFVDWFINILQSKPTQASTEVAVEDVVSDDEPDPDLAGLSEEQSDD